MADTGIAKIFKNGRSQAVRLPKEFRLPGDRVRVRRMGRGVLLEPMFTDVKEWFAEMDRLQNRYGPFLEDVEIADLPMPEPKPEDLFD